MYRAAWALCGSREDGEDLAQDTFARVLSRPRVVRGDERCYLLQALRNTFYTRLRAASRPPRTTSPPDGFEPVDPRSPAPDRMAETARFWTRSRSCPRTFAWRSSRSASSGSPMRRRRRRWTRAKRRSPPGCTARASGSPPSSPRWTGPIPGAGPPRGKDLVRNGVLRDGRPHARRPDVPTPTSLDSPTVPCPLPSVRRYALGRGHPRS
jgi:hypothetical protein